MKRIMIVGIILVFVLSLGLTSLAQAQTKVSFGLGGYSHNGNGESSKITGFNVAYYLQPTLRIRGEVTKFTIGEQGITSLMVGGIYTVTSYRLGRVILRPYIGSGMGYLLLPAGYALGMQVVGGVELGTEAMYEDLSLALELKYRISSMAVEPSGGLFFGFFLNVSLRKFPFL